MNTIRRNIEYESYIQLIVDFVKAAHSSNFHYLNEDFDDLGSIFNSTPVYSKGISGELKLILDDEQSIDPNLSIEYGNNSFTHIKAEDKQLGRRDSMGNFTQAPNNQSQNHGKLENSNSKIIDPNNDILLDESFERALIEAKKSVDCFFLIHVI
jgi:hypothetical protein